MGQMTTEFLDQVQSRSFVRERDHAVDGSRAVFYALFVGRSDEETRRLTDLLPEELEPLWKPPSFELLREEGSGRPPETEEEFCTAVSDRLDHLSPEGARRLTGAVLVSLREHLPPATWSEVEQLLPGSLRAVWQE